MAGFWKDVMAAAIESTPTGQAVSQIKQAANDYNAAKNPPPPAPPTPLTPQQQTAVAGAQANKQRPLVPMSQPAGAPQPKAITPFTRPSIGMSKGVRPLLPVPTPKVFTQQQQQAITGAQANKQRLNLQVAQPWSTEPTASPVAKSRTQKRPSKRGLAPQAKVAFARLHEHFDNQ